MLTRCVALAALALAGAAQAQTPLPLSNTSFENPNIFNPVEPAGWHNLSSPTRALWREIGDSDSPAAVARTGTHSIELRADNNGGFLGFTTDTTNWFAPNQPFYDPVFRWLEGDVIVSGYYYVPSSNPILGDRAGIKLNPKLNNQDYGAKEALVIDETAPTNTWTYFELRWPIHELRNNVLNLNLPGACGRPAGCFDVPLPPNYPERIKILFCRYAPDGTLTGGSIFWDDVAFRQACATDLNADGFVDDTDFVIFAQAYDSFTCPGTPLDGEGCPGDFNIDGFVDDTDFVIFAQSYDLFACSFE